MSNPKQITVVIAEDQALIREGLVLVCQSRDLQVVAQCADGLTALEAIRSLKPDFALLDLNMPKLSGVEVVRKVREAAIPTHCIILTISREESAIREALKVGVDGYLLKDGPPRHLTDAINYVRDGGVYVSPLLPPGERSARQGDRQSAGYQPQDGGHLPRQPDAQAQHSRSRGAGQIRHRAQTDDHVAPCGAGWYPARRLVIGANWAD
jgi:DNA-binding NarL/FixJ family response regulator